MTAVPSLQRWSRTWLEGSGDDAVAACWRYLLVSGRYVKTVKSSWEALKGPRGV